MDHINGEDLMNMSAQIFINKCLCFDEMEHVYNTNKHIICVCDSLNISYLSMCKLLRNISYTTPMIIRTYEEADIFKVKVRKILCFHELRKLKK